MEGYEVITPDDEIVGRVVKRRPDYLIVEHGLLRKTRHAIPASTVEVDRGAKKVRTSFSKEIIKASPKVENGSLDEEAVAAHYGLGGDSTAPATEGYGATEPADPARSAEQDAISEGIEPGPQERARIQKGESASGLPEESPALLGDRLAGIDEKNQERRD